MGAARTTLTMQEFLALPEAEAGKRELLNGELLEAPPAKKRHNQIIHLIYKALQLAMQPGRVGGEAYIEMGYEVAPRNWLPRDVSITDPDQPGGEYFTGAHQLAVEVVSPGNTVDEINAKVDAYLTHGAAEVWVLYPDAHQLWVFAPDISAMRRDHAFRSAVLNGETVELDRILE